MSTQILIKRSATSGSIPTTVDIAVGELAVNTADKRLYTNQGGTIVELGTYPSAQAVQGNATVGGTLGVTGATTLTSGTAATWTVTGTLTVPTPSNSTDAASKGYVDTAVSNILDSAPEALNTLNELAAALGDDANFATTVTNALATKLNLAGGTMTGNITMGANKVTSTATPSTDDDLTRKGYVDDILGSATAAADSAAAAATSATNAGNSATSAAASATTATTQASAASTSATNASSSATAAAGSATSAANSATSAATSATSAGTSATNADASETAAATSETNAASSATAAASSASAAATSETNAATSATNAATSATAAASSATAAATSETNAATSESNAANSATSASTSAAAAATSETNAATSETNAATSETNAAASATAAHNSALTLNIDAIDKDILDTAVDVFVYDTSKDSDGGAWRKRTQHTSWYNETLNTATRGSRKEFPAVAVIVAETNKVTIYDGDDPSLPMWMVFNTNNSLISRANATMINGYNLIKVKALNGILGSCSNFAYHDGALTINFLSDLATLYSVAGYDNSDKPISLRNETNHWLGWDSNKPIASNQVNDIAMTVLPNAPIDSATGLPVPTIAVATDGGVSVIKDDGTVVDSTVTGGHDSVAFISDNRLWLSRGNAAAIEFGALPTSDTTSSTWRDTYYNQTDGALVFVGTGTTPALIESNATVGTSSGLTLLDENTTTPSEGSVAYITSTYNTGWMNGDIKLATLSDTDTTDVTGTELVTNGTFDTDTTGWSIREGDGTFTSSSSQGVLTYGTGATSFQQDVSVTIGKTYTIVVEYAGGTSTIAQAYYNDTTDVGMGNITEPNATTLTATVTAQTSSIKVFVRVATSGTAIFDNVSVRLAEEDRSVNGNGLKVFGTVTKNPVATGADLVAYSGFSASNYLEAPRGSFTPISTDDFFMQCWVLHTGAAGDVTFGAHNFDGNTTDRGLQVYINNASQLYLVLMQGSTWIANIQLGLAGFSYGTWNHVGVARRNGVAYLYINGKLSNSASFAWDAWDASGANIRSSVTSFKHSLFRISGTAPTAEQIEKIYNDEKVLFQEGAQATLYGSSDAVTALAYDDTTELLHVGTSAGRSDFSGLRRVNNTTTGVTTAISASNSLIVEQ